MSSPRTIHIQGQAFVMVATINEGQTLYFYGGRTIAVEKMDMRPGATEFDFEVNSRATAGGRAMDIASTRAALDREFIESRVKSNVYGLPISGGNALAMARGAPVELSYGELQPQVFSSKQKGGVLAWTVAFRHAYYNGVASRNLRAPTAANAPQVAARATAMANGSAAARAISGHGDRALANGRVQAIGVDAVLRLYVPQRELVRYHPSAEPFGRHDVIFHSPTIFERLRAMLGGGR